MDYSRQKEIFDNTKVENLPIHIIGAGATGSLLTVTLVKLGFQNINVYDFDTIEAHNIPNQMYFNKDIGRLKIDALKEMCDALGEHPISVYPHKVTSESGHSLSGVVFVLTDTMLSRKEIWETLIKYKPSVQLMIETRMGAGVGAIYTISPFNETHISRYESTLFSDEQAVVSACGSSQSIMPTANITANYAVWQLIKFANADFEFKDIHNEIHVDIKWGNIIQFKYELKNQEEEI